MPFWLDLIAWISLAAAALSFLVIVLDEMRNPQPMWIMNIVWPVTALYGSIFALAFYLRFGRQPRQPAPEQHSHMEKPFPAATAIAATHCGSGCTLGDILAEWSAFFAPVILTWFGYRTLFDDRLFATWVLDFILAFLLGILFQYFTIAPMRHLTRARGIRQALKADTLSLTAWQVGMYGWMAIAVFLIFHRDLHQNSPVFWLMMQIAMLVGFALSYPVNWWLLRRGIKEKM